MSDADRLLSLLRQGSSGRTVLSEHLSKGDVVGHAFHGNQWSGGGGTTPADGSSRGLKEGDVGKNVAVKTFNGNDLKVGEHSLADHLVADGKGGWKLDGETQQRLGERITAATAGVPKSSEPTLHMLGGGPAAGKSTITEDPRYAIPTTGEHGTARQAVLVNADEEKEANPTYQRMLAAGDPRAASFCHEESSYFAKQIQMAAMKNGQDVVLDGTGNSKLASVVGKIDAAHEAGYKVNGIYVTCPTDEAVSRAVARAEKTGRVVPESTIRSTHASVSRIVPEIASKFDSFKLVDTTPGGKDSGKVIAETTFGKPLTVNSPDAYQTFLDKGKETK
jgi:predicted ABC-type ATPase